MFPFQFSYSVDIRLAEPDDQLGERLIIGYIDCIGEPTALEGCHGSSFPCDSAHLPDNFQWVSQVHQECPTADKVRPAVFNGNVVRVTFTKSDLPCQPFLLSLFFSGPDVGGPNVHSNDDTFSRYEAGEVSGEVSCTASYIHDFHSGLQPEKSGVHLFNPWFGLKKSAIDFPATA